MEIIRPIATRDVEALYAISLATGSAGGDASHLYHDPRMMGHIYAAPYAVLEPEFGLVIEDRDGVAGFAVGALDTRAWEARLEAEWWPQLRGRYADPPEASRHSWTPDERRAFMIHHPAKAPADIVDRYPAHLHLNLLPRLQGRGLGLKLFGAWHRIAIRHGARGLHVGVNRENRRAVRFWEKAGFAMPGRDLGEERTIWMVRD